MDKQQAIQAAVNAVATATQAVNDYGSNSAEAKGALKTAKNKVSEARAHGATDDDLRAAHPQ